MFSGISLGRQEISSSDCMCDIIPPPNFTPAHVSSFTNIIGTFTTTALFLSTAKKSICVISDFLGSLCRSFNITSIVFLSIVSLITLL